MNHCINVESLKVLSKLANCMRCQDKCGGNLFTVRMATGARWRELMSGLHLELENLRPDVKGELQMETP